MTEYTSLYRRLAEARAMGPSGPPSTYYGRAAAPPTPPVTVQATPPQLPPFEQPGATASQYMPFYTGPQQSPAAAPAPAPQPPTMTAIAPPTTPAAMPDMPPPVQIGPQASLAQAMPVGRNQLERDYYAQLAANPNGFDRGWLGRLLG